MDNSDDTINIIHIKPKQRNIAQTMETVDRRYLELQCRYILVNYRAEAFHASKWFKR